MARSEFVVDHPWQTDVRGPIRWILSHLKRHKLLIAGILIGAAGNAVSAAVIPFYTGFAFDTITGDQPSLRPLLWASLALVGTQVVRFGLQMARNFGSEVLGQRLERDARQELYASLLGKSMGFHDLRPTGEVMA
ncbi:MAG: ABC transporter ATP-binding protein, partial [Chloroflexi bacterium]